FFQAEVGIRYRNVTGVQTCALPIWFLFCGQHQLPPVKAVAAVKESLQVAVAERQQPGAHPSLIALLTLALQIHLALGGDDGFYRSEERRVGKECRCRWLMYYVNENE